MQNYRLHTEYDRNGNIRRLQRYGQTGAAAYGLIDNLTCTLSGNRLTRVDDAATASAYNNAFEFKDAVKQADEYAYDANGNLTKDLNKNISNIQYNCLNLPGVVTFTDGSTITYTYAADGTKLRTVHKTGGTTTTTDYCGTVIYENGKAKLLLTEAGYVTLTDNKYHYYLRDHQGNNRVVVDQSGAVKETNHYYPFGGLFASASSVQPYKYNGKELDTNKGLNWYDYGARHYDAALGRWHVVDPLAEKYYPISPYAYCGNNPGNWIDKNGKEYGPGDMFPTIRDAAVDWGMYYNGASILQKREFFSIIYSNVNETGEKQFYYSKAKIGTEHNVTLPTEEELFDKNVVATIHSHGNYDTEPVKDKKGNILRDENGNTFRYNDNNFSKIDKKNNWTFLLNGYLATPKGCLLEHNLTNDNIFIVNSNLPSDPNDPSRVNKNPPIDRTKDNKSTWTTVINFIKELFSL